MQIYTFFSIYHRKKSTIFYQFFRNGKNLHKIKRRGVRSDAPLPRILTMYSVAKLIIFVVFEDIQALWECAYRPLPHNMQAKPLLQHSL